MIDIIKRIIAFIITHFITIGIIVFIGLVIIIGQMENVRQMWQGGNYMGAIVTVGVFAMLFAIYKIITKHNDK